MPKHGRPSRIWCRITYTLTFISVIGVLIGLAFFNLIDNTEEKLMSRCTKFVQATVTDNVIMFTNNGAIYKPVYEWEYEGVTYSQTQISGSSMPLYDIGDKVHIQINPKNPSEMWDNNFRLSSSILGKILSMISFACAIYFFSMHIMFRIKYKTDMLVHNLESELEYYTKEQSN